jgi:hypothetical protein
MRHEGEFQLGKIKDRGTRAKLGFCSDKFGQPDCVFLRSAMHRLTNFLSDRQGWEREHRNGRANVQNSTDSAARNV